MNFKPEDYRYYLAETDLTDAQKDELMRELWKMMQAFVDGAWGEDSEALTRDERRHLGPAERPEELRRALS